MTRTIRRPKLSKEDVQAQMKNRAATIPSGKTYDRHDERAQIEWERKAEGTIPTP